MEEHLEGEAARCNNNLKKNAFIEISMYAADGEEQRTAQKTSSYKLICNQLINPPTAKASNTAGGCLLEL